MPVNFYMDINKGDKVLIKGKLDQNNYNPFDIFLNNKLTYIVKQGEINVIYKNLKKDIFFTVHKFFVDKIKQMFLPREGFLASMIIFGKSGGYSKELDEIFRNAGLSHILVVSGMQLTMFIDILNYIFILLPVGLYFFVFSSLGFIIFFILMVGFSASMLRAGVMVLLQVLSKLNHRIYNISNALLLSILVILLINPITLLIDLGFQLTFLSIISLIYISPVIGEYFKRVFNNKYEGFVLILSVALGVYIGMTPFLIYKMSSISLVSPLANLIVVPLIEPALSLISAVLILNILGGRIFWIFNMLVSLYLKFVLMIVEFFASGKYANYPIAKISFAVLFMYYLFLVIYLVRYYMHNKHLTLRF